MKSSPFQIVVYLFVLLIALNAKAQDTPISGPAQKLSQAWADSKTSILLVGESSFHNNEAPILFRNLVRLNLANLDFIGFELSSTAQPYLDQYMRGEDLDLNEIAFGGLRDTRVLPIVRDWNLAHPGRQIRVLAIDSKADQPASVDRRSSDMFHNVYNYTGPGQRGLIYVGGAHAAKREFMVHKAGQVLNGMRGSIKPLGARLWDVPDLNEEITSVFVQGKMAFVEMLALGAFRDTRPMLKIKANPSLAPGQVYAADDQTFLRAEATAGMTRATPMQFSRHFDFYLKLPSAKDCESEILAEGL